ncbi:unnamed protein product [Cyprideis torosa]|uniref:Uncharacterized protein n=1 Tax=Cyprideis torosa TaxID=163714 RepID=A0A7R8ZMK8_9CRUS|nr:unnamed protein product [Cyprideis torosa]CAG0894466.1 unnamed protein product [Cyprideis torosa]
MSPLAQKLIGMGPLALGLVAFVVLCLIEPGVAYYPEKEYLKWNPAYFNSYDRDEFPAMRIWKRFGGYGSPGKLIGMGPLALGLVAFVVLCLIEPGVAYYPEKEYLKWNPAYFNSYDRDEFPAMRIWKRFGGYGSPGVVGNDNYDLMFHHLRPESNLKREWLFSRKRRAAPLDDIN